MNLPPLPSDAAADLAAIETAATQAVAHPFVPGPVRELVPLLVRVLKAQDQSLRELRDAYSDGTSIANAMLRQEHDARFIEAMRRSNDRLPTEDPRAA